MRGITPVRVSVPLSTGAAVHEGLAALLGGKGIEEATQAGLEAYDGMVLGRGLQIEGNETLEFLYSEQKALCEALIRAYGLWRLPRLLEEYRVVEIEQEDLAPLPAMVMVPEPGSNILVARPVTWMSRADALLVRRDTEDLEVMSFKTAASWDDRQESAARHDMQGLSEPWAIEQRLRRWAKVLDGEASAPRPPEWYVSLAKSLGYAPTRILAVRMEFLLKGERRKNDEGVYATQSPLIRGFRREVTPFDPPELAWSYYWTCSVPHPMRKSKWYPNGQCPGDGRRHKISDDFQAFSVWESEGGVRGWIESLAKGEVQPGAGDPLASAFALPVPFYRQDADTQRWLTQVSTQEARVAQDSLKVRSARSQEEFETLLDKHFPMYTGSCDWPSKCPYQEICFGQCPRLDEVPELYMPRRPHHQPEAQLPEEKPLPKAA